MEQSTSSDAPAGRPFVGNRGVAPLVLNDPHADWRFTDTIVGFPDGANLILIGVVGPWQRRVTRQGRAWATGTLVLDSGEHVEFHAFPDLYTACGGLLAEGERRVWHVRLDRRDTTPRVNVRALNSPDHVTGAGTVLTDQVLEDLAAEAESGYDPDKLIAQRPAGYRWEQHRG